MVPAVWSRRRFLKAGLVGSLAVPFFSSCTTMQKTARVVSPNGKLNHACIGVGGMGWGDLQNFLQHPRVQVVALCDVDSANLDKASKAVPGARLYADWRELLQKEAEGIDSANVAVPDHMHFSIAYSAVQAGKHVYCQSPCATMWRRCELSLGQQSRTGLLPN